MKIFRFIFGNILFFVTLFLLVFIPLYPKKPLFDIQNTWVYIRAEDVIVLFILFFWILLLSLKKVTLKTPLTIPIILFWIAGAISTLHGVMLLFPMLSNVFSNVAFLSMLRRIEYMSLFFIAFASMKNKKFISYVAITLMIALFLVAMYGFGQKFLGFPAYLTMNEEFAKGVPIKLSELSRIPSTFAGHYDLAAYLVLIIPILVSLFFGFKNWLMKVSLLATSALGFALLFMTVSRVSFFVLLLSLVLLLLFQKKRLIVLSLFVLTIAFLILSPRLLERFGSTVAEIDVLVDAKTGYSIGKVKEVPAQYFENKTVLRQPISVPDTESASSSAILPFSLIPPKAALIEELNSPNGENLPQGTSYINLPLSPVVKKLDTYFYQKSKNQGGVELTEIRVYYGDFVIKKAKAYDLSFTTRFQGEWPKTWLAFKRNIFFGSGYGSVSLAVDNDYLRILGESGAFGLIAFASIFLIAGIYIKKILPKVNSPIAQNFTLGFTAGTFGLALNAILIDVFEASKVAFVFWVLMGVTLGILNIYKTEEIDLYKEFKKIVTSFYAFIVYIFISVWVLFSSAFNYYFVGDDFTWLRWIASCYNCQPMNTIVNYFTQADGFFYRPGAKLYFSLMYSAFWLNQTVYHIASILLHFSVVVLVLLISRKIFKNLFLSGAVAGIFLILSGHHEVVFWISGTGFIFNAVFSLLSLLFFIYWRENKKRIYLIASIVFIALSLLFHEMGVIAPLLVILYDIVFREGLQKIFSRKVYYLLLFPVLPYILMRYLASSHWFSGDYSYNLLKLPYNIIGNIVGYLSLSLFGPQSLSFYDKLRFFSRDHVALAVLGLILMFFLFLATYKFFIKKIEQSEKKIVIFGFLFFAISLLPFLGLGNITSRYSYLSSFGVVILLVFFLKKTYEYLLTNGKHIAIASTVLLGIIFISLQLFQLQKMQADWREAGEKSKSFLTSINYVYAHYSLEDTKNLYFVDVPIRNGQAWVFPVGLPDLVWLVFRNDNIKAHQAQSVEQAFDLIENIGIGKVFKFNPNGSLMRMVKTQSGEIVPLGQ